MKLLSIRSDAHDSKHVTYFDGEKLKYFSVEEIIKINTMDLIVSMVGLNFRCMGY